MTDFLVVKRREKTDQAGGGRRALLCLRTRASRRASRRPEPSWPVCPGCFCWLPPVPFRQAGGEPCWAWTRRGGAGGPDTALSGGWRAR